MPFTDEKRDIQIEIHGRNYNITDADRTDLDRCMVTLKRAVGRFPDPSLHVDVHRHNHGNFHVKMTMNLAGATLFTGERNAEHLHPAFKQCIHKLIKKAGHLKDHLKGKEVYTRKGRGLEKAQG